MSRIAQKPTDLTAEEFIEYDFRTVRSVNDVDMTLPARGSVRLGSGLIIGNDDLDDERRRFNVPVESLLRRESVFVRLLRFLTRKTRGEAGKPVEP